MAGEKVVDSHFTGRPLDIVSDVLRVISAYTREDRVRWFKIGITNNPKIRFQRAYAKLYDKMIVVYRSSSLNNVSDLECELIEHNRDLADNMIGGGGGNYGDLVLTAFSASPSSPTAGSPWPTKRGVYIATSSKTIPLFPRALSKYRSENNKDFCDHAFASKGSIRIFEGGGWTGIPDFPATMSGCSHGVFMIRWRSGLPIESALGFHERTVSSGPKTGAFGYMYGTNCEQPMFRFVRTAGNGSTLTDVFYELKFWQAAP